MTDTAEPMSDLAFEELAETRPPELSRPVRRRSMHAVRTRPRLNSRGWMALHLASLLVSLAILLVLNRHAWFIYDEWDMVVRATQPLTLHDLFVPHNEHWSTIPILIYRMMLDVFGLRTYLPYMCVLFAAHLGLTHLLWRLMRQVGASIGSATALAATFGVLGAGAENLTNAFQLSFVISVAAGVGAMVLVNVDVLQGARRQVGAVALLLLGLMSSNVGITMTICVTLVALLRHGYKVALRLVTLPAAAYGAWFMAFGHSSLSTDRITLTTLAGLPRYVWTGFTSALAGFSGIPGSGGVLVLVVVVYCLWRSSVAQTKQAPALAGVPSVIALFLSAGLVRTFLGTSEAASTRYAYIAVALLLALFSLGITDLLRRTDHYFGTILGLLVLLLVAGGNLAQLRSAAVGLRPLERTSQEEIFSSAELVRNNAQLAGAPPAPQLDPNVDEAALRAIVRAGFLPRDLPVSASARLDAETAMQTAATATALTPPRAMVVLAVRIDGGPAHPDAQGCVSAPGVGATVSVSTDGPTALQVEPLSGTTMGIQLRTGTSGGTVGTQVSDALAASGPTYLDLLGTQMFVVLTSMNPTFTVCGLQNRGPSGMGR